MLERTELYELVCAAILHDIGKTRIPDSVLNKPGKLTPEEIQLVKTHPVQGYSILADTHSLSTNILQGVLTHHKRLDGSGYPLGLKDSQINLLARIIAVADTYDAMTASSASAIKGYPFADLTFILL